MGASVWSGSSLGSGGRQQNNLFHSPLFPFLLNLVPAIKNKTIRHRHEHMRPETRAPASNPGTSAAATFPTVPQTPTSRASSPHRVRTIQRSRRRCVTLTSLTPKMSSYPNPKTVFLAQNETSTGRGAWWGTGGRPWSQGTRGSGSATGSRYPSGATTLGPRFLWTPSQPASKSVTKPSSFCSTHSKLRFEARRGLLTARRGEDRKPQAHLSEGQALPGQE